VFSRRQAEPQTYFYKEAAPVDRFQPVDKRPHGLLPQGCDPSVRIGDHSSPNRRPIVETLLYAADAFLT